ncbi:EPIDERMAL PATTERNING FACTOR-like protein 4 [Typha angustifolia]|uniref:EPIDERMAL PATTERNING FACTOR-like protein 4 n=1 Tax=Typha angustifolia TaxID=59011 RepID=UPI003C2C277C
MGVLRHWKHRLSAILAILFFGAALGGALEGLVQEGDQDNWEPTVWARRRLAGPGSSPPTCRARCGKCFPCRPVHVAIQPGRSILLEYYPEAWRCKCGNKLFMP